AEERVRSIAGRADGLLRQAEEEREARLRAERRRRLRAEQSRVAEAVAQAARMALDRIGASLAEADARRAEAEQRRAERDAELKTVRARVRELSVELEKLVNVVHGSEVARAERKLRLEQLETRAMEEMGVEVPVLIAEYGPRAPVPPPPGAEGEDAVPLPYVREVQERSEEHTSELQSRENLVCRLLLDKKKRH